MRFVDEYRDPELAKGLRAAIAQAAQQTGPVRIMEVCGGHTHAIYRFGLEDLLPPEVTLVHGPGCPVCVVPMGRIDDAIHLSLQPDVTLACYGDLLRVPGNRRSLQDAQASGGDVRVVYSPLDALTLAQQEPERHVVFLAVGFETTAPATALTIQRAAALGLDNFSVLSNHVTIVPALKALLDSPGFQLDGFIGPGHVSTVIGIEPYRFVPEEYGRPVVVCGFEPVDVLDAVLAILHQRIAGEARVENRYERVVPSAGNRAAIRAITDVFELRPHFEWRGLGTLPHSALRLRDEYATFDAERRHSVPALRIADPRACQCGEVLKGAIEPWECKVFGTACTPETPIGTCMVSSEGACAAYYAYGRGLEPAP